MVDESLNEFYKEIAAAACRDLAKQKMLLPVDSLKELCAAHCRTHRAVASALLGSAQERSQRKPEHFLAVLQKAYPGEGVVNSDFKPLEAAQSLENLTAVIGVNTEKHFFEGAASFLTGVTHLVKSPVVRWDFIIDEYQLGQSRLWGADAVRIAAALLDQAELLKICQSAKQLELEVIAEIADQTGLERVLALKDLVSAVYIKNDLLADNEIQALLQQIPLHTPALININSWRQSNDKTFCCDALVLDHSSCATAEGVEKLRKSL